MKTMILNSDADVSRVMMRCMPNISIPRIIYMDVVIIIDKLGRYVLDAITDKKILVEYDDNNEGITYVICECGKHALYHWNIGTYYYKCKCGWKSKCGIKYPELFIGAERLREAGIVI